MLFSLEKTRVKPGTVLIETVLSGDYLYKNGRFGEIGGWSQILQIVGNLALFYLSSDKHDSPGSFFIWKWGKFSPHLLV